MITRTLTAPRRSNLQPQLVRVLCALLFTSCSEDAKFIPPPPACNAGVDGGCAQPCNPEVEHCGAALELGAYCDESEQCATEHCVPDEARRYRCCDAACAEGCNAAGDCFEATASRPSSTGAPSSPSSTSTPPKPRDPAASSDTGSAPSGPSSVGSAPSESTSKPVPGAADPSADAVDTVPALSTDVESGAVDSPKVVLEIKDCAPDATRACAAAGALGNCGHGKQPCEDGHWSTCSVQPKARDACNIEGDDADCNGIPNEGCECETGACESDGVVVNECTLGQTRACEEHAGLDGKGACRAGQQTCEGGESGNRFGACLGAVGPEGGDSCDIMGDDSNCNGMPNEGCAEMMPTTQPTATQPPVEQPPTTQPPVNQPPTTLVGSLLFGFDSNAQGWQLRLTDPDSLKSSSQVAFSSSQGDPQAGSLIVKMPFSGHNQKMEFNVQLEESLNVTGKQFRARVMLLSGLSTDTNAPGGIKFFAKAGDDYVYVSGRWRYLTTPGQWEEVFLDASAPDLTTGDFDLEDVREIGFELRTFQDTTQISPAVVHIDSITY